MGTTLSGCHPSGLHLLPTAGFKRQENGSPMTKTAVLTTILFACTGAMGQTVFGQPDCGQWIKNPLPTHKAWILGYISGLNTVHVIEKQKPADPLDKVSSADQIYLWIDNYCKSNPLNKGSQAAWELFMELKTK